MEAITTIYVSGELEGAFQPIGGFHEYFYVIENDMAFPNGFDIIMLEVSPALVTCLHDPEHLIQHLIDT